MRTLDLNTVINPFADAVRHALIDVDAKTDAKLKQACENEKSSAARWALEQLVLNNQTARTTQSYACQDTGLAVVFAEVGQSLRMEGLLLRDAVNKSIEIAYAQARKSAAHPLTRINTQTNTPAVLHTEIVEGEVLKLTFLAKGAGSENMSKLYMLTPSKGRAGIINAVVDCVTAAGANPCPPIILGVGVGGTMEKAALMAKHALTRETGKISGDADTAALEREIFAAVNALGIGAQGLGGDTTALSVAVETFPTHIGMLPVAVNVQCHSVRHAVLTF